MLVEWLPSIALGFGLGLAHALDADHVMAVSALSNQRPSLRRSIRFSANWALGHSGVLLACGLALFALGVALPPALQQASEIAVGALLILLGLWCFWRFRQESIELQAHRHGDIVHTHWQH